MTGWIIVLSLGLFAAGSVWLAQRRNARRQSRRRLEMELRLATAWESFEQEVLRLQPLTRIKAKHLNSNYYPIIPSKSLDSLRYIKGHRDED